MYYPRNPSVDLFTSPPISCPLWGQVENGAMMLYPASHWLGGLPQWSTDEEDVNGSGISESDMRAVRAQAARCRRQSPEAGGVWADDGAEYAELPGAAAASFPTSACTDRTPI